MSRKKAKVVEVCSLCKEPGHHAKHGRYEYRYPNPDDVFDICEPDFKLIWCANMPVDKGYWARVRKVGA